MIIIIKKTNVNWVVVHCSIWFHLLGVVRWGWYYGRFWTAKEKVREKQTLILWSLACIWVHSLSFVCPSYMLFGTITIYEANIGDECSIIGERVCWWIHGGGLDVVCFSCQWPWSEFNGEVKKLQSTFATCKQFFWESTFNGQ